MTSLARGLQGPAPGVPPSPNDSTCASARYRRAFFAPRPVPKDKPHAQPPTDPKRLAAPCAGWLQHMYH